MTERRKHYYLIIRVEYFAGNREQHQVTETNRGRLQLGLGPMGKHNDQPRGKPLPTRALYGLALLAGVLLSGAAISPASAAGSAAIRHGTFFGQCAGYCASEIEVSGTSVVYRARAIREAGESLPPEKTQKSSITNDAWNQLLQTVQEDEFVKLKDRYGCPDCADQGGEWIEISFADGKAKKVTFDYNRPPAELLELVKKLQAIQGTFGDKPGILGSAAPIPNQPTPR